MRTKPTFHELYEQYATDVHRFAYWLCGDSAESEDITSETFIRAWSSRDKIRTETIKAYLFTIARNYFLQQQRKNKRQVALSESLAEQSASPEQIAGDRAELDSLREDLLTLPEVDRSALILHAQHQLPYAEIARVLNISVANAKVKVYRARRKLLLLRSAEMESSS